MSTKKNIKNRLKQKNQKKVQINEDALVDVIEQIVGECVQEEKKKWIAEVKQKYTFTKKPIQEQKKPVKKTKKTKEQILEQRVKFLESKLARMESRSKKK